MPLSEPIIKHREIVLRGPADRTLQAETASIMLRDAAGVLQATRIDSLRISVSYDLRHVTLEELETALAEVGYHLDGSLLSKLMRALHFYAEDNERDNIGLAKNTCSRGCSTRVFAKHYAEREHGCRDHRPEHIKHYF